MRHIENRNMSALNRLPIVVPVLGLLLVVGCDGMVEEGEPVDAQASALRNNGRTPDQQKCDEKLQSCYIDCSVRYPDSSGGFNDQLREGCFDSCDAAHRLCLPARTGVGTVSGGALQGTAVPDARLTTEQAVGISQSPSGRCRHRTRGACRAEVVHGGQRWRSVVLRCHLHAALPEVHVHAPARHNLDIDPDRDAGP